MFDYQPDVVKVIVNEHQRQLLQEAHEARLERASRCCKPRKLTFLMNLRMAVARLFA